MNIAKPVRVRFAPSPTGHLHIGGARTALFNYLLAKQTGGQFILRIEDTDRKRLVEGAEQEIFDGLRWLGIHWDEGPDLGGKNDPYRQSERKDIYIKFANELIDLDKAYYCFCTPDRLEEVRQAQQKNKQVPHYDGTCRRISLQEAQDRVAYGERHVIRFKMMQDGTTTVRDHIRGNITVENRVLDDTVLVKSDGLALYHLAAAVDDHLMGITHVIRGSEWLPTFPLHGLVHRSFGWEEPIWVHLSVFLKPSGKGKMSKRETNDLIKDGHSIFVKDLEGLGYLPESVVNWIALMGWAYDDHTEYFTMQELIEKFSIDHLNPSPAAINFQKFDYFNGVHIRSISESDLARRMLPFLEKADLHPSLETLEKIAPIVRERLVTLDDIVELTGFFFRDIQYTLSDLIGKEMSAEQTQAVLEKTLIIVRSLKQIVSSELETPLRNFVEQSELSAGQVFGILRIAITGQKVSPPLFESMEILGKSVIEKRLETALKIINE